MAIAHKLISTRRGSIAVAAFAAALAGTFILVYLRSYRESVQSVGAPVTVLVAKKPIPKGTPGSAIAAQTLYASTTIRESQLREGALSDASSLRDRVADHDIYQGQQLTEADFSTSGSSLASTLTRAQRVVSIPIDSAHGLIGQAQEGDHVDILAGFNVIPLRADGTPINGGQSRPVLRMIMQNVPVVRVVKPGGGMGGGGSSTVSLRVNDRQAAELAFASDNGKVWLSLRPSAGAKSTRPGIVTVETMLLGVPPITVVRSLGGHR